MQFCVNNPLYFVDSGCIYASKQEELSYLICLIVKTTPGFGPHHLVLSLQGFLEDILSIHVHI